MKRVLLGLGSNKTYDGHSPCELLSFAREELSVIMSDCSFSSVYKTKAMYVENQEDFFNMAAIGFVSDDENPFEFLQKINKIEAKYGRDRSKEIRFGPRSLDIDIELFGDEKINTLELQIPHIRMEERAFVLIPTLEILNNPADELIREKYTNCLNQLKKDGCADDVVKFVSQEVVKNGRTKR